MGGRALVALALLATPTPSAACVAEWEYEAANKVAVYKFDGGRISVGCGGESGELKITIRTTRYLGTARGRSTIRHIDANVDRLPNFRYAWRFEGHEAELTNPNATTLLIAAMSDGRHMSVHVSNAAGQIVRHDIGLFSSRSSIARTREACSS